jgi:hypothetical protein
MALIWMNIEMENGVQNYSFTACFEFLSQLPRGRTENNHSDLTMNISSAAEIWVVDISIMKQNASHCARVVEVCMKFQIDSLNYRQLGV